LEFDTSLFQMIKGIDLSETEVMLGPSIISSRTGKRQNPFYDQRISTSKLRMLNIAFSNYITYALYQMLGITKAIIQARDKDNDERRRQVYAIHGSFMIFKSSFLEAYFQELTDAPFLFGEEIQFAEVAFRHHLKTLYDPTFRVTHHEHATTKLFKSRKMLGHLKDSIEFMLKKRKEKGA